MSFLVKQYHAEIDKIIRYGGTTKETSVRGAFQHLLNEYCKQKNLLLITELNYCTILGKTVRPDGTVKDMLRQDWGYWESKDLDDDLDEEINKKFAKGYPQDNIIFEDTDTAILYQGSAPIIRVPMRDAGALDELLKTFLTYERPEVRSFRQAIDQFKQHIPAIVKALRETIDTESNTNLTFCEARTRFLEVCQRYINSAVKADDVREMLIQHILTEEIFLTIFEESQFHSENNIARELKKVEDTFFTGSVKRSTLEEVRPYYGYIKARAAAIADHHEKQNFLKIIYENFYKAYNPKGANRLGVVYTPNEIVRFMIQSTDYLLGKHFGRMLGDMGVEILDPATGTGTYIAELIDYLPKEQLRYKYLHEIHANEVSILPYYIANLNIEYTYRQRIGKYEEFKNICFVDTLDNIDSLGYEGKQGELFGISVENAERIKRQNQREISVVIGNPPYNAKQENFNDNNANRKYPHVDQRIQNTYIKEGTAQNKTDLYNMYVRFYRWACDRLNKYGIVALITDNSFINGRTFDGFRKCLHKEFDYIYLVDLGGSVKANEKLSGSKHNVFGIQQGVVITFLVKSHQKVDSYKSCRINYLRRPEFDTAKDKLTFLQQNKFETLAFEHIVPDLKNNWLYQTDNDFDDLLPLIDKNVKAGKDEKALFKLFSSGIKSQRDEWVYDMNYDNLVAKMQLFTGVYQNEIENRRRPEAQQIRPEYEIKWDAELVNYLSRNIRKQFTEKSINKCLYRPFYKSNLYYDIHFNGRTYQWPDIYRSSSANLFIAFSAPGNTKPFHCLATNLIADLHLTGDSQCIPLYCFDKAGNPVINVTNWGLQQFRNHYAEESEITKEDIFYYVYAVLHNSEYRKKYDLNLKRDFPRIPFYKDFHQWAAWGKQLMHLHINYENVESYPLQEKSINKENPKTKLKAIKANGSIEIDESTMLAGIPKEAWEYKLGNRSALEWILDQYKESKPKDPTIAANFNTYRFSNYKIQVIDLLKRICTVSIETVKIQNAMEEIVSGTKSVL